MTLTRISMGNELNWSNWRGQRAFRMSHFRFFLPEIVQRSLALLNIHFFNVQLYLWILGNLAGGYYLYDVRHDPWPDMTRLFFTESSVKDAPKGRPSPNGASLCRFLSAKFHGYCTNAHIHTSGAKNNRHISPPYTNKKQQLYSNSLPIEIPK